ncbi:TIGR04255 family protein [Scandinavium goeteborgense]|uniref:TIGR04255 family protein n=1 Tax=Scandinavium goeteborgense TaxID=1851514 RepID=UPI003808DB4A
MTRKLPTRLRKDLLVGVIFEMRFESVVPLSSILPGLLFNHLAGATITKTPVSEIPESIRNSDPNFIYAPLVILETEKFQVHIGDKVLQVIYNVPYEGWDQFKLAIMDVYKKVISYSLINKVLRFSLKYIDIIEPENCSSLEAMLNVNLSMGNCKLDFNTSQARTEIFNDNSIVVIQMAGGAKAEFANSSIKSREGFLIDVDCIRNVISKNLVSFESELSSGLDELHMITKEYFFSFLTDEALELLGAEYD